MIQYSLEVAICWSVLFLIYICFLKRETFFSINRGYLLSSLLIGLVIPLLRMIEWQWQEEVVLTESLQFIAAGPSYIATSISPEPIHETSSWSALNILLALYWLGVIFMMARLAKGIQKIYTLYKQGHKTKKEGFTLVETNQFHLPFSFLHCVFFSKELSINEDVEHIIKHELTHIKSRHSYDVFFVEILHVLFWWNPLIYLYKRELRQLHEYLADAMVLTDTNQKIYGQILLGQSESGLEIALTHQFFNSHLKQRIMMMYKQKSKRPAMIKYLVALPVILILAITFSSYLDIDSNEDWAKNMEQRFKLYEIQPAYGNNIQSIFIRTADLLDDDALNKKHVLEHFKNLTKKYNYNFKTKTTGNNIDLIYESESLDFTYNVNVRSKQFTFKKNLIDVPNPIGTSLENVTFLDLNEHDKLLFKNARNYSEMLTAKGETFLSGCCTEVSPADIKADQVFVTRGSSSDYEIYLYRTDENINSNLVNELNDFFSTHQMIGGENGIGKKFFELRKDYPGYLVEIDARFDLEAKKSNTAFGYVDSGEMTGFSIVSCWDGNPGLRPYSEMENHFMSMRTDTLPPSNPQIESIRHKYDSTLKVAEIMPRFPGCEDGYGTAQAKEECAKQKMIEYIYKNLQYPAEARKNKIEGLTVIQFIVDTDGSLTDITIARDIGGGAGAAAKQVVESMNTNGLIWSPGVQAGKVEKVLFTLPVKFKLEDQNDTGASQEEKRSIPHGDHKINEIKVAEGEQDKTIYKVVEEMPRFPGCENMAGTLKEKEDCAKKRMLEFIYENLKYPEEARKGKFEGMTVVQFVVAPSGQLEDVKLLRDIGGGAGEAALGVVNLMSERNLTWRPGMQRGEKVHVNYIIPIRFKLTDEKKEGEIPEVPVIRNSDQSRNLSNQNTAKAKTDPALQEVINRGPKMSPIYDALSFMRKDFQGSSPLMIVNGNKYERHTVNFNAIDITQSQIKSVNYLEQSTAQKKYGEIAFHGAVEIILDNVTETQLEQIGKIVTPGSQVLSIKEKEQVFKVVENMPRFPDCEDKCTGANATEDCHKNEMLEFIYSHLQYPEEAKHAGIEGVAVVQFVIDKSGTVIEPKVVRDIGGGTAKEVLYVVELMNNLTKKWTPGHQRGEAVNVLYTLPVRFKLDASQKNDNAGKQIELENLKAEKEPLYILNGEIFKGDFKTIDKNEVETLHIVKGEEAIKKYGDKGVNGVVEITTKKKSRQILPEANKVREVIAIPTGEKISTSDFDNQLNSSQDDYNMTISPFKLMQNKPNPVENSTIIGFNLPQASHAELTFYNIAGKQIFTKSQPEKYNQGYNEISISKEELNFDGVVYYTLVAGDFKATMKMIVLE